MTLRELIVHCCGGYPNSIKVVPALSTLEIKGFENFCLYPILKYFNTEEFQWDQHNCQLDLDEAIYNGLYPYLVIDRDKDCNFFIAIKAEELSVCEPQ